MLFGMTYSLSILRKMKQQDALKLAQDGWGLERYEQRASFGGGPFGVWHLE